MFSIIDAGAGAAEGRKMGAERACDQCKVRKGWLRAYNPVRAIMTIVRASKTCGGYMLTFMQ